MRLNGSEAAAEAYLKWLQIRTEGLLASSWHVVESVAVALLERGSLNRAEIGEVITGAAKAVSKSHRTGVIRINGDTNQRDDSLAGEV
jgi:hypothetical protein